MGLGKAILTVGAIAGASYVAYNYILDDEQRAQVRAGAANARDALERGYENVRARVGEPNNFNDVKYMTDVERQWARLGL